MRQQLGEVRQQLQVSQKQAEQARLKQQRYTRDVEDRAFREIDRAREENKAAIAQIKEANGRLQVMQQTLLTSQRDLSEVREQRATAQTQANSLRDQLEHHHRAGADAAGQHKAVQHRLLRAEAELANVREQSAAAQARAETLGEQLGMANRSTSTAERPRRPRKAPPKTS